MKIGVILPAYNVEKFVGACLDSILAQTHRDFEVCAMNDGSSDRTHEILLEYARRDPRVRVFTQKNRGLVRTMNALLERLSDDVGAIAFVDSDDYIHPQMFERLMEVLERTRADVVECGIARVPTDAVCPAGLELRPQVSEWRIDDMSAYWLARTAPAGWINKVNKLYRRDRIAGIRFRETLSYEDDNFFAREINAAISCKVIVGDVLYAYRDNPESSTVLRSFDRYVRTCCERIRLTQEVFLNAGRVPPDLVGEYRRELARDAYRMCIRKNLKKNRNREERRKLFGQASRFFAELERESGFRPTGLGPFQWLVWMCCRRGWYGCARILSRLT